MDDFPNISSSATEVAKGISEWGMTAVTAAFFLILSAALMIACFRWFKQVFTDLLTQTKASVAGQTDTMGKLLDEMQTMNMSLAGLAEGLRPEVMLKIKNMSGAFFDLAVERVCQFFAKIKDENHIANKEATHQKITMLIENLHEDRNSRFDSYTFNGKKLSTYTNKEWVNWVVNVLESELYNDDQNMGRLRTNVQTTYNRIKLDFYKRLGGD